MVMVMMMMMMMMSLLWVQDLHTLDKTREKSQGCWALGGGLASQAPGLATFQVLHDKTNSINMKPGLQFGHRLMISVCFCPGIINRNPELQSLKSHPQSRLAAWDPFPTGAPGVLWLRDIPALIKSGCWSKPNLVMYSLFFLCLSFLMLVFWIKLGNSLMNIYIIH